MSDVAPTDWKKLYFAACDRYDRKNRSGCVCAIDPETDQIRSPCALHADWLVEAVAAERERCAKLVETQDTYGDPVSGWLEMLAAKIRANT